MKSKRSIPYSMGAAIAYFLILCVALIISASTAAILVLLYRFIIGG